LWRPAQPTGPAPPLRLLAATRTSQSRGHQPPDGSLVFRSGNTVSTESGHCALA